MSNMYREYILISDLRLVQCCSAAVLHTVTRTVHFPRRGDKHFESPKNYVIPKRASIS